MPVSCTSFVSYPSYDRSVGCQDDVKAHASWCGSLEAALARSSNQAAIKPSHSTSNPAQPEINVRGLLAAAGPAGPGSVGSSDGTQSARHPALTRKLQQQMQELSLGGAEAVSHAPKTAPPVKRAPLKGIGNTGRGARPPQRDGSASEAHWAAGNNKFPIMAAEVKVR